jgi:hypothetical protein
VSWEACRIASPRRWAARRMCLPRYLSWWRMSSRGRSVTEDTGRVYHSFAGSGTGPRSILSTSWSVCASTPRVRNSAICRVGDRRRKSPGDSWWYCVSPLVSSFDSFSIYAPVPMVDLSLHPVWETRCFHSVRAASGSHCRHGSVS